MSDTRLGSHPPIQQRVHPPWPGRARPSIQAIRSLRVALGIESLETISRQDELRAIELVNLIETGQYEMTHKNTQKMTVITQNSIPKKTGKKIKHGKGTHNHNTHKFKCDVCKISYQGNADLTTHNKKIHTLNECKICKTQTYGEDAFNDHTKACKTQRDRIRQENDKKDRERKKANPNYKNMYNHLMVETPAKIEEITEKDKKNIIEKQKRKEERAKVKAEKQAIINTKKMEELFNSTTKEERMEIDRERAKKQKIEEDIKKAENCKKKQNKVRS